MILRALIATLCVQSAETPAQNAPQPPPPAPATQASPDGVRELLGRAGEATGLPLQAELERAVDLRRKLGRTATRLRPNVVRLSVDVTVPSGAPAIVPSTVPSMIIEASGFVLGPSGRIVTFGGVLNGARRVAVRFPNTPNLRPRRARVIGVDELTDVGLLEVGPIELPGLELGAPAAAPAAPPDGSVRDVTFRSAADPTTRFVVTVAMASDDSAPDSGVSLGRLDASLRNPRVGPRRYQQVFELTIARPPENAGGVVAQADGQVVGLLLPPPVLLGTVDPPVSGMLALPALALREGVERVLAQAASAPPAPPDAARAAWVGFGATDLHELQFLRQLGANGAVVVDEVFEASPALAAGLEPNDVIVAWDGEPVSDVQELTRRIGAARPGAKVVLDCVRRLERRKFEVTLGAW